MNKKIILAVVFFIILLMAIPLFQAFLFTHQTSGKIIVEKQVDNSFFKHPSKNLSLVFFGYVGCTKVCTPILYQLDSFYDSAEFSPLKPFVGVSFVNLMPDVQPDQPKAFAQSFNPNFEGIYLEQKELMGIDREFNLFFSKSLSEPSEIDHSDHLYLIEQKNGVVVLKYIYSTHPINRELIISDIKRTLSEKL